MRPPKSFNVVRMPNARISPLADSSPTTTHRTTIGFREGRSFDCERPNWDGTGPRPLCWSAWYPAAETSGVYRLLRSSWFASGPVAPNAPIRPRREPYFPVLLSHGNGGLAEGMGWLGRRLAARGFVALAVNHHGNTSAEPYRPEGFACLWERARDLSVLLRDQDWPSSFGDSIRTGDAFVAGFSAGAYAAILLLGAVTSFSPFDNSRQTRVSARPPREFPDLSERIGELLDRSKAFRESWGRMSLSYRDCRFKAGILCAPGPSVLGLDEESLASIGAPVRIVVGEADAVASAQECSGWLHQRLPNSVLDVLGPDIGHNVFLSEPTSLGMRLAPEHFLDTLETHRRPVHEHVARAADELFQAAIAGRSASAE
jgi:predicted dienelactone hydrolase